MSKRNIRAKSGKQLYINTSFNKGMLYTASEIPEGYSKIIDNLDVSPSGDAVSPRAPFMKTNHGIEGLSKYTYPIQFQGAPNKQFYINFANVITEQEYVNDELIGDYNQKFQKQSLNVYSRSNNALNGVYTLDENNNTDYNPNYNGEELQLSIITSPTAAPYISMLIGPKSKEDYVNIPAIQFYNVSSGEAGGLLADQMLNSFEVIDADTISINNTKTKYRLANINAPEKGYKWYEFGKRTLNNLLSVIVNFNYTSTPIRYNLISYGEDIYGRQIAEIILCIYEDTYSETPSRWYVSLSTMIAAIGIAKVEYANNSSPFFDILLNMQDNAKNYPRFIWDQDAIDFLHKTKNNTIIYDNLKSDYNGDFSDLCLEVVSLQNEKRINYDISNIIDKVMYSYIDHLDSIAIIGRILSNDYNIYYKGLIYIKYECVDDMNYFKITLPPNELNGDLVNIVNATSNGYNLLNEDPINTSNTSINYLPTSCLGIVATSPDNPNRIITQAVPGNTIRLRAVMNESFYTPTINNPILSCKLYYTLYYRRVKRYNAGIYEYYEYTKENSVDLLTNNIKLPDTKEVKGSYYIDLQINKLEVTYTFYDSERTHSILINSPKYNLYLSPDPPADDWKEKNVQFHTIIGDVTIDMYNLQLGEDDDGRYCIDNLDINIILPDNLINNLYNDSNTEVSLTSKWEVADYNSDLFKDITNFTKAYIVDKHTNKVIRVNTNNDTYDYNVHKQHSLSFRYTIVPTYEFTLIDNSKIIVCYKTQESYTVLPLLNVGTISEWIDKEQLTENINIKDATRLGVYNRQIYLYGPYLKTNTIFFSKFEQPWYFSFPYYSIDTEERIKYITVWNSNLVLFGDKSIWLLVAESTVNESSVHKIYDQLSISDTDIDLVSTTGNNLIFFNNNNGYIATSSKYYDDPTNISVYKLTEQINNCLSNPKYLYRSLANVPLRKNIVNIIRCQYKIYVDNDYVVILCNMNLDGKHLLILYRYNQLYKYWSTYSIHNDNIKYITGIYTCEPNIGTQFTVTNGSTFDVLYMDNTSSLRKDFNSYNITTTLDTGFLSIDPLNDKRFKDIILDLNHIQKNSIINIYTNFFIDGVPILLSDNNDTAEFEYDTPILSVPDFKEGDYQFKYVLEVDVDAPHQQPYGKYIESDTYNIRVQGRNQLRIPVFGKGRLPSIVFKIDTDKFYEIVGYSIIYKEKNVNIRRA